MFEGHDHTSLAAAAITELLGGDNVVEIIHRHQLGHSIRQIADATGTPRATVARWLEVSEAKVERVKARAASLAKTTV